MAPIDIQYALPTGTRIGKYEIQRTLGAGGFGITYVAEDPDSGKMWAVKEFYPRAFCARSDVAVTIHTDVDSSSYKFALKKFNEEAERLLSFDHPNIVGVHEKPIKANNTSYIVMDFIEGLSLETWLRRRKKAPTEKDLRAIFEKVFDAVGYLHEREFMHRDLSPENIMLQPDGTPVLIDFGTMGEGLNRGASTIQFRRDEYSPPEQGAEGLKQAAYTDIFALGGVLYRAVVGKPPAKATLRTVQISQNESDPYVPAIGAVENTKDYTHTFLDAIDQALRLHATERPQTIDAWLSQMGWDDRKTEIDGRRTKTSKSEGTPAVVAPTSKRQNYNTKTKVAIAAALALMIAGSVVGMTWDKVSPWMKESGVKTAGADVLVIAGKDRNQDQQKLLAELEKKRREKAEQNRQAKLVADREAERQRQTQLREAERKRKEAAAEIERIRLVNLKKAAELEKARIQLEAERRRLRELEQIRKLENERKKLEAERKRLQRERERQAKIDLERSEREALEKRRRAQEAEQRRIREQTERRKLEAARARRAADVEGIKNFLKREYMQEGHTTHWVPANRYAPSVYYYGKFVSASKVLKDKEKYFRRWPYAKYELEDDSIVIQKVGSSPFYRAKWNYSFSLRRPGQSLNGRGVSMLKIELTGQGIRIHEEGGEVLQKW